MTTAEHVVFVWHPVVGKLHQAECSCGWAGDFMLSILSAEADADGHTQNSSEETK